MGGKGEFDVSITGGADPRDDYSRISSVLPVDWATFEDGAGEVEEMDPGNWVDAGGPPWYYPFTEVTLSEYDFFAFSLYLFFSNEVGSVGALAASGDYYMDLGNNRVYIYGYDGGGGPMPPAFSGYMHAVSEQFTVTGAGQKVILEDHMDGSLGLGFRRIGSLNPSYRTFNNSTTRLNQYSFFSFFNGVVWSLAYGSPSYNRYNQSPTHEGRAGFYFSEDDGESWEFATGAAPWEAQPGHSLDQQGLIDTPVRWRDDIIDPWNNWTLDTHETPFYDINSNAFITNSIDYRQPTGNVGFLPTSLDGSFGIFLNRTGPGRVFSTGMLQLGGGGAVEIVDIASYGKRWVASPQIPWNQSGTRPWLGALSGWGPGDLEISGNDARLTSACRDARSLVDPTNYGGKVWALTRNREVLLMHCDEVAFLFNPTIGPRVQKIGATLPGIASDSNMITSTYDVTTGKMWLHAFTRWGTGTYGPWGFYYSRSQDEGASWSTVNFPATHDPDWGSSNWRYDGEARSMHTIQFLISPDMRTIFVSMYAQVSFGFLSYRYVSSHMFRSTTHGATWDKFTAGAAGRPWDTGSGTGTQGWSRGVDGFFRGVGSPSVVFLGSVADGPPTEFYIFSEQWKYEQVYHFQTNYTGSHAGAMDSITFPAFDEEPHINGNPDEYGGQVVRNWIIEFSGHTSGDTFLDEHAPNYNESLLPCGFQRKSSRVQKVNDYYFRVGGFGKHKYWDTGGRPTGCDNYNNNQYDRGDYIEFSILPLDAVITGIADESGFIIRAQHVNELRQKLQTLNATVQARGTNATNFGIDVSDVPTVAQDKTPVRADHYGNLRREFESKIRPISAVAPGGSWLYTDDGVDLTDAEYDMPLPVADGPDGVSIRTLIGMRKIIQALYLNGWFCSCYSYCPCQTHIIVSGGGGKK